MEPFKKVGKLPEEKTPKKQEHNIAERFAFAMIDNPGERYLYGGMLKEQVAYGEINAAHQKWCPDTRSGWDTNVEQREVDGETYLQVTNGDTPSDWVPTSIRSAAP